PFQRPPAGRDKNLQQPHAAAQAAGGAFRRGNGLRYAFPTHEEIPSQAAHLQVGSDSQRCPERASGRLAVSVLGTRAVLTNSFRLGKTVRDDFFTRLVPKPSRRLRATM